MPTPANLTEEPAATRAWTLVLAHRQGRGRSDPSRGRQPPHPTAMPAWRNILTEQQKWAVLFYGMNMTNSKGAPKPVPAGGGQ